MCHFSCTCPTLVYILLISSKKKLNLTLFSCQLRVDVVHFNIIIKFQERIFSNKEKQFFRSIFS